VSLNWKEIDLVLAELALPGAQIQRVYQSAYDVLHLELYGKIPGTDQLGRRFLLVALSPGACRIHETARPPVKPPKPLRFAEFCKSRIVNGRIEDASQLGDDRVVRIVIRRGEQRYFFWARLWSNAANVIITGEDGIILDAMRRLPRRGEITGGYFMPGVPDGTPDAAPHNSGRSAEYAVRELPGAGTFNERLDAWYAEHAGALSLESLREDARKWYGARIGRLTRSLEKLREKEADYAAAEKYREYGDIIMANLGNIRAGDAWLEAENFYGSGLIRIALDAGKKPASVAEEYYARYRKGKTGREELAREIREEDDETARLRQALESLLAETNPLVLHQRLKKRAAGNGAVAGGAETGAQAGKKKRPGLTFRRREWLIMVGRDAAENDTLLRRHVRGQDLWLHAREYAGSYVFIRGKSGKSVPLDILLDAGNLALFYSKGRNNAAGDLFYTRVKFLRRVKDGPRGLVIPTQEKNLRITLDQARLRELETCRVDRNG
jgi:predicted ribosome quality control (RQC) complex YloA/Tae2 family protein